MGWSSIQRRMIRFREGPTAGSSSSDRPSCTSCAASSGHRKARLEARRSAFCKGCLAVSAAVARSSAISELFKLSMLVLLLNEMR